MHNIVCHGFAVVVADLYALTTVSTGKGLKPRKCILLSLINLLGLTLLLRSCALLCQHTATRDQCAQTWEGQRQRQGRTAARNPHLLPIRSTSGRSATYTKRAVHHPTTSEEAPSRERWLWRRFRAPPPSRFRRQRGRGRVKFTKRTFAAEWRVVSASPIAKGV